MLHWRPHRPTLHSRRSCPPNQPPFRRDARAGDHPRNRTADHQSSPCWEVLKQPRLPTHSSRFGAQPRVPCSPPEKPAGQPWKPKCAPTPEPPEPGWEPGQSGRCLPRVSAQPLRLPRAMRRSQTIRSPFAILQKATEPSIQQIQRPIHPRRRVTPLFPVATLFPGIGALFGHPRDRVPAVLRPREPVRAAAESGWQATPPTEVLWRKNLPCPTSPADWQAAEHRLPRPGLSQNQANCPWKSPDPPLFGASTLHHSVACRRVQPVPCEHPPTIDSRYPHRGLWRAAPKATGTN